MTTWNERAGDGLPPGCRVAEARLANGLKAVIVEAPAARQTRLVLGVGAGYLDEPEIHPGLAHLLEHALFLDSTALAGWVGERGGRYNAHTDDEVTDYHLTLPPSATAEGVERLLSLVASPRFQADAIDHEVSVIDAEFQARLADPALHRQAALSRLCLASHPARLCHAGNRATLGDDAALLCQALSDFHGQYYRAGGMALVMLAPLALSEQQALIETAATQLVAGGNSPRRTWRWAGFEAESKAGSEPEPETEPGTKPKPRGIRWVSPTGERTLELLWPVPPQAMPTQQRLLERVATALTNGVLAATLAQNGCWLRDLSATTAADAAGNVLSLTMTLTDSGSVNTATILSTCQAAVLALANQVGSLGLFPSQAVDLDRWSLEQVRKLARERSADVHGESMPNLSDQTMLATWLASQRCRILEAVAALDGESLQAPVTGTRYQLFAASPECVTPLALIQPPMLEPRRLAPLEPQAPLRRLSSDGAPTLWHGGGLTVTEASLCLGWPSDTAIQQGRLQQWRQRSLVVRQTAAGQGVALTLGTDAQGDWLIARGRATLLENVATQAIQCWPRETPRDEPQASGLIAQRLLARLEIPDIGNRSDDRLSPCCWIAGLSSDDAKAMADRLHATLAQRLAGLRSPEFAMRNALATGNVYRLPPQGDDYAVMLQIDARDASASSRLYLQLLMHCHDAAFFRDMRQQRGLGYVAAVRYRQAGNWPRLGYVVQSPHTDVAALQQAIGDFLASQGAALARLDSAAFERQREALRAMVGPPETADEALLKQWQGLRFDASPDAPWQATLDALERIDPQGLIEHAEALVNGELRWRWWAHEPGDDLAGLAYGCVAE